MILYRYIVREVMTTFVGVTSVLFLIFLGGLVIRFLPDVSSGSIPVDKFLPIIGVRILEELIVGIPFAFFLALMVAIGKLFSESELIAAYACGLQRTKVLTTVVVVAFILSMLVGIVSIVLAPMADQRYQEILAEIEQKSELSSITPGKFVPLSGGGLIYAETGDENGLFGNVSIFDTTTTGQSVVNANTLAEGANRENGKLLIFGDGIKTTRTKESNEVQITEFKEYGVKIETKNVSPAHSLYAVPVAELWGSTDPARIAELQWRISTPLMMLVLAVVAVAISRYKPRSGKYGRLIIAIVIYMVYSHLIMSSKVAIKHSTISPSIGIWWVHLMIFMVFIALFFYQEKRAG